MGNTNPEDAKKLHHSSAIHNIKQAQDAEQYGGAAQKKVSNF